MKKITKKTKIKKKPLVSWGPGKYVTRGDASSRHRAKAFIYGAKAGLAAAAAKAAHNSGETKLRNIAIGFSVAATGIAALHARKSQKGKKKISKTKSGLNIRGKSVHGNLLRIKPKVLKQEAYNTVTNYVDFNY
jgi:hypothetical protein